LTQPTHTATAYLCMMHRLENGIPKFLGFQIFSSPPWGLSVCGNKFPTIYYQVNAETYGEARKKILDLCSTFEPMAWVWPWLDPSYEAHVHRFNMEREAGILP